MNRFAGFSTLARLVSGSRGSLRVPSSASCQALVPHGIDALATPLAELSTIRRGFALVATRVCEESTQHDTAWWTSSLVVAGVLCGVCIPNPVGCHFEDDSAAAVSTLTGYANRFFPLIYYLVSQTCCVKMSV